MGVLRFILQSCALGIVIAACFVLFNQYILKKQSQIYSNQGVINAPQLTSPPNSWLPPATPLESKTVTNKSKPTQKPDTLVQKTPEKAPKIKSFSSAVDRAAQSVVNIFVTRNKEQGNGSGVIVNPLGYILTNYHVIKGTSDIKVMLNDGRDFKAVLVGTDIDTDLALLKIEAQDLTAITLETQYPVNVGDVVLAIGNPFGVGQTVTMGIVSATGRNHIGLNAFENFIQTDAAINPGNSGGALVNSNGHLVGVNTAIYSKDGGSQGIGFSIPVQMITDVLAQLVDKGYVTRGWIGAAGRDLTTSAKQRLNIKHGAYIDDVVEGGPAYAAGLQKGDIITHIDNDPIQNVQDVLKHVSEKPPGGTLTLKGIRTGKTFETTMIIAQRPTV